MMRSGYVGFFAPKSRAKTMEDYSTVDGCATFYRLAKFSLAEEQVVEYQTLAMSKHKEYGNDPEAFTRLMTRDNIATTLVLQLKERVVSTTPQYLLICNTHIHWNPEFSDVKLMQVILLLEHLATISSPNSKYGKIPIVVAGDFNSGLDSGVYNLLVNGALSSDHSDFETYKYGNLSTHGTSHNLNLASSYGPIGEPPFTNYTGNFVGVLDYIMYTKDLLSVSKVLQPVEEDTIRVSRLPNVFMPSDHISLVAEFFFTR